MKHLGLLVLFFITSAFAADPGHLVSWCSVFTMNGEPVHTFPGDNCLFLEDGTFISATTTGIRRIGVKDEVLWEIPGIFHHQMNFSADGKRILAISAVAKKEKDHTTYDDELLVISTGGEIEARRLSSSLLQESKLTPLMWSRDIHVKDEHRPVKEISHLNSFYEFSPVTKPKAPGFLRKGGFVVNGLSNGVFILSQDLSTTLHQATFPTSDDHWVHDVQVTPEGDFLAFNNRVRDPTALSSYSSVELLRATDHKVLWSYRATPKEFFYSQFGGSVQVTGNGNVLIADHLNGTFVYSRPEKKLVHVVRNTHLRNGWLLPVLQVKALDLSSFLKNRFRK